jgi:hypothetical protein
LSGRKTKLTEEVQSSFTGLIAQGIFVRQACEFVGISEQTIYNWMARGSAEIKARPIKKEAPYVSFFQQVKKAENTSEIRSVTQWQNAIKDGDWRAAKDFLARRFPDRWSPRIEITGAEGAPVQVNMNVDVVTLEQKVLAVLEMRNASAISGSDTVIESD